MKPKAMENGKKHTFELLLILTLFSAMVAAVIHSINNF